MLEMIGKHKFKIAIAVPLGLLALYKLYKYFKKQPTVATETELQNEDEVAPTPAEIDDILNKVSMQLPEPGEAKSFGLTLGTKPVPMEKERNNVWFDKSFEITPMELRHGVSSVKSMDINQFANLIAKNIFKVEIFSDAWSGKTHLLGIVGQVFLVNTHAYVKCSDSIVLRAQVGVSNTGIKNIVTLNLHKTQFRLLSGDISFIVLGAMPACKDITKYFSDTALEGKHKGFYIFPFLKNKVQAVKYIEYNPLTYFTALEINSDAYESTVHTPTVIGSCGCPLVISNGHGYIVAGFHFSGNATKAYSIPLAYNMFKTILKDIHVMYQYEPGVIKLKYPSKEHSLTNLHNKSPFRYIEEGIANVYGSFVGFRPSRKSRVGPTFCQDWFVKHGYKVNMYAPDIKSWKPWYIAADAYCKNQHRWNDLLIAGCAESFKIDILSKIDSKQLADVKPLDIETAVNGAPGVAYIDPMPRGTSTGFPYKTTKAKYLTLREDKTVEVHQEILDTIEEIKQCYLRKEKYNVIFCANLKDEPVSASKKESGKARVFAGSPFAWSILCRQYLLPVVRLIQNNKFIFEAGPGTITQSNEWGAIFKYLTKSGKYTKFVNGDYKNYDKGMYGEFIRYAGFICSEICREAGYSEEDLLIVNGLFADMVKALMDFNGDLVQFLGSMPSGIPLTVIVNCIVNSLYMRYVFVVIMTMPPSEFQKYVRLYTYGDDNVLGVSDDLMGKYNHTSIAKVFGVYNLTYTMANKDEESRPFVTAEEISFLKRTWKFDFDMQTYLAPLDHDSINKMLTVCVHSKSVPLEAQTVSAMSSALSEYFFYGKKIFLEKRELMLKCIEENDLHCWTSKSSFPTYQELVERFNSQGTIEDFYSSAVCRD